MNSSIVKKNSELSYHIITKCDKDLLYDGDDESNNKKNKIEIKLKKKKDCKYCGSVFIMDL
tara:strand:- start:488 stop:670 length:183 start_codon:yes stop_codon:yes gene_type:complete